MEVSMQLIPENVDKVVNDIKKQFKNIPMGLISSISGGGGGATSSASNIASGVGKLATTMVGAVTILGAIALSVKAIVSRMREASPYLRGMFEVMNRASTYFFKPFGDFLASMLRPLAFWLLRASLKFMQWAKMTPEGQVAVAGATGAGVGATVGAAIGGALGMVGGPGGAMAGAGVGGVVGGAIGGGAGNVENADKGINNLGTIASAWTDELMKVFGIDMNQVRSNVASFLQEKFPALFELLNGNFGEAVNKANEAWSGWGMVINEKVNEFSEKMKGFGAWLWGKITGSFNTAWEKLKEFGKWLWDGLTEAFIASWDALKGFGKWLMDSIETAIGNIGSAFGNFWEWIVGLIKDAIRSLLPGAMGSGNQVGLNYVPETGLYQLHRGETVTTAGRSNNNTSNKSIILSPNISLAGANIRSEVDIDSLMRRASRSIELDLRSRGVLN